jgi:glycerol-3-phosphate dehydrogenase subunit C
LSEDTFKPVLDWSSYQDAGMGDAYADIPKHGGNFAKAVAVCINSRQCETEFKGVMCPSYRVLHESLHSTGGRVRLLKAALNAETDAIPFADSELAAAMDLCVACKGCKRECENEVDMAMIKVEYLAQLLSKTKPPLRTRLLANLSRQLQYRQGIRYLLKLRNRIPLLAKLGEALFGLSAQRTLPEPVASSYLQSPPVFARRDASTDTRTQFHADVVLLIDTFTNHFAPENAKAAIRVLSRAGYRVITTQTNADRDRPLCCGRTHIAHGLVDEARKEAKRMLKALLPHAEAGRTIIGLEPACLLAIRDDYKFLGLGEAADKVAKHAILFEEFIAKEITAKRFELKFNSLDSEEPLLVHGHCHQKAVGAMKSMRKVLKLIPDLKFELIESSCCGMAGSFGIEQEHAEVAMQMAEQSLLPAIRQQPQARILANGFSCRHQIREGADRPAMHIAQLLNEAMA